MGLRSMSPTWLEFGGPRKLVRQIQSFGGCYTIEVVVLVNIAKSSSRFSALDQSKLGD